MADVMEQRAVTAAQAAAALGYPAGLTRRASIRAAAIVRGRQARPHLADVAQALHARGWTTTHTPPIVLHPEDDACVSALVLDSPTAPAGALMWSERHGWRTSSSRRHPLGRGAPWAPARGHGAPPSHRHHPRPCRPREGAGQHQLTH
ncbi:hypothetical protein ACFQ7M_37915 [Streptomyces massasporeus]